MVVWDVLVDLGGCSQWNPLLREGQGTVAVGNRLTFMQFPVRGRPMKLQPVVLVADPGIELRWVAKTRACSEANMSSP